MSRKKIDRRPAFEPLESLAPNEKDELIIEGLRQNNLKNLYLKIPHNKITTIIGPSGSGKSSLAFDTLFAEGRWRFIESLSTYTRLFLERMDRPDLDSIRNIRPAIAVEQKNPVRTSRSTVGTATELNDYLRLLFARVGKIHCPECGEIVKPYDPNLAAEKLIAENIGKPLYAGFNLSTKNRDPKELSEELLRKGFIRIKAGSELIDIGENELPQELPHEIGVITDRLIIKDSERHRIVESLETAFREGNGEAWAEVVGKGVERFTTELQCPRCGTKVERPTPLSLSFNHPVGACPVCKGFGNILRYDENKVVPDRTLSLRGGAIEPWTKPSYAWWYEELEKNADEYGVNLDKPFSELTSEERKLVFEGTSDFEGINGFFDYLESKKYKLHIKVFSSRYKGQVSCKECGGTRLKKSALTVRLDGLNIAEASRLSIRQARDFFKGLTLTPLEQEISKELLKQINVKLEFLNQTGLGYITLDRLTKTLSGGESQRVTIATQLASSLCGVLYILDEPSIGLHPVDVDTLNKQIKKLASMGNTVVTVEHDPSMIMGSDYIVELGPGSGQKGGQLVYAGPMNDFLKNAKTLTSDYLTGRQVIHIPRWRRNGSGKFLTLKGATANNLKDVTLKIPLKTLTCVTGVSGSGKSTLIVDTFYNILAAHYGEKFEPPLPYRSIEGMGNITGVKLVDQSPIGRTPRSNPLTYIGGFDEIRHLYASLSSARALGLSPGDFSFNVPGGRCEVCKGEGVEKLEMYFLPDVYIKCAACGGKRYKTHVLDVKYRGRSIFDVLETTFDEAVQLFPSEPNLQKRFSILKDVGLGYLKLGQAATTLSGGEAQRLKIARELVDDTNGDILYILDEPTTGLHMDDTRKLLSVLGRLVDSGNTVLLIEHNLDCIKTADYIIDLGPEGGDGGGRIVAEGTPETIANSKESRTGKYLKQILR
ncbi:MAG: excinuclease ABC subunit UvrA [Deltaproteobacteria bacterium]|nr:excinuclease ABC subunit UvrA [Deltaproteobacteria bacterium]